jgi:hypothetical protein
MKNRTRSFVVDVKRPRLAAAASSAPTATWFTKLAEAPHEPFVQVRQAVPDADPIPTQEARRILPDLSPIKTWKEPKAAGRKPKATASVDQVSVPRERDTRRRQDAVPTPPSETRIETLARVPRIGSKPTPWLRLRAEDLPRGQRWKRRIPRSAW